MLASEQRDVVVDWAVSGAFALTGRQAGPPVLPAGRAATVIREQLACLGLEIPGLLGERAAYAGLTRNGPSSCGGAFRTTPAGEGWIGLSLARESDIELIPALVEDTVDEPWSAVERWAAGIPASVAADRLRLLGLPGGIVGDPSADARPGTVVTTLGDRPVVEEPLIVDLTSLWAGPLCAHLLGLSGARVVKVESRARPDGARRGPADFFALLHNGHRSLTFDFDTQIDDLHTLITSADLVLEASRPRALRQLGIVAEDVVASGTSWLSITARGRDDDAVGFGDDVAACAGLVCWEAGEPLPIGDAIADPLAGVAAAVAADTALRSEEARLIDVSMLHVAAEARSAPIPHCVQRRGDEWWVEYDGGAVRIEDPRRRR